MANQKRTNLIKQDEVESKHRSKQQEPESTFDHFYDSNVDYFSLSETTFDPRMDEHAELLAQAVAHSDVAVHNLVMQLHQTYGNRYVQRLLNSNVIQAKLTVDTPGDIYEQEADRIADKVISAEKSQVQRQEEEEEEVQAQRQEEEEELQAQRQLVEEEEVEQVQAQSVEGQPDAVSESIEARINNARGSGHPFSDNVREPMEHAFGVDFSDVRVHTDSEANLLNQQLSARAFTTARDIFFRQDEYSPNSDSGKKLIAHELTHVVQQSASCVSGDKGNMTIRPAGEAIKPTREAASNIQRTVSIGAPSIGPLRGAEKDADCYVTYTKPSGRTKTKVIIERWVKAASVTNANPKGGPKVYQLTAGNINEYPKIRYGDQKLLEAQDEEKLLNDATWQIDGPGDMRRSITEMGENLVKIHDAPGWKQVAYPYMALYADFEYHVQEVTDWPNSGLDTFIRSKGKRFASTRWLAETMASRGPPIGQLYEMGPLGQRHRGVDYKNLSFHFEIHIP